MSEDSISIDEGQAVKGPKEFIVEELSDSEDSSVAE
jgi:hypothetical protein